MTDLLRDDQFDREIRSFLAGYAEDVGDAPTASEIAMRLSSRLGTGTPGLRMSPGVAWAALVVLVAIALLGAVVIGALSQPRLTDRMPTNGWIAYSTRAHTAMSLAAAGEIYLVREGTAPRLIAGGDGSRAVCPSFSPDGTMLSYLGGGEVVVLTGDFDGSIREEGRYGLGGGIGHTCPAWSPTGDVIAVLDGRDILLLGLDGSRTTLPVGDGPIQFGDVVLAWSPDGASFAFATTTGILIVPLDGDPYSVTTSPALSPAWSADGSRLALYEQVDGPDGPVMVVTLGTEGPAPRVTLGPGSRPVWSPAGYEVAYLTGDGVVIQRPDGSDRRLVGVANAYGFGGWSPDGRQVLQMVDDGGMDWDLVSATTDGRSTTVIALSIATASARNWPNQGDVSWQVIYK